MKFNGHRISYVVVSDNTGKWITCTACHWREQWSADGTRHMIQHEQDCPGYTREPNVYSNSYKRTMYDLRTTEESETPRQHGFGLRRKDHWFRADVYLDIAYTKMGLSKTLVGKYLYNKWENALRDAGAVEEGKGNDLVVCRRTPPVH